MQKRRGEVAPGQWIAWSGLAACSATAGCGTASPRHRAQVQRYGTTRGARPPAHWALPLPLPRVRVSR